MAGGGMRYRLVCPTCGKSLYATHEHIGERLLCRACGEPTLVPPGFGAPGEARLIPDPEPGNPDPQGPPALDETPQEPTDSEIDDGPALVSPKQPNQRRR